MDQLQIFIRKVNRELETKMKFKEVKELHILDYQAGNELKTFNPKQPFHKC